MRIAGLLLMLISMPVLSQTLSEGLEQTGIADTAFQQRLFSDDQ